MPNKNAFLDAEELLSGAETFWVVFAEDIDNIHRDEIEVKPGLYHWMTDVYIFEAEKGVLAISFGHPNESEIHYTTEVELLVKYRKLIDHMNNMLGTIQVELKRDAL